MPNGSGNDKTDNESCKCRLPGRSSQNAKQDEYNDNRNGTDEKGEEKIASNRAERLAKR
jgi:hypothetical protein